MMNVCACESYDKKMSGKLFKYKAVEISWLQTERSDHIHPDHAANRLIRGQVMKGVAGFSSRVLHIVDLNLTLKKQ